MHVLISSIPPTGHMNPTLRIGKGLLARGHKVTLLTSRQWIKAENGAAGKFSSEVEGMKLLPMDDAFTNNTAEDIKRVEAEYALKIPRNVVKKILEIGDEAVVAPLEGLHAEEPIDYAMIDYFGVSVMEQLTKMGIDFCVHLPTPSSFLWFCRVQGTEDWSWMDLGQRIEFFALRKFFFYYMVERHKTVSSSKPWIVDSFAEVDRFIPLPAHCKYSGSIAPVPSPNGLASHGDFASFFQSAAEAQLPIICVSLGSMVRPDAVIIKALCEGLSGGPWRVVWSLYDGGVERLKKLSAIDSKQFLLSAWIPQAAILAHPQCQLFLTHGGWGGLMEAAAAGKPVLCLPFFGDQPGNAMLVEKTGWGLALPNQKVPPLEALKDPPTWTGKLKADEVRAKAVTILETPSFGECSENIKKGALRYGGQSGAAAQVEEWATLSKQGRLPKPVNVQARRVLGSCCPVLCG